MASRSKIIKPAHAEPEDFWLDFILLPYGEFYKPSQDVINAKKGDVLRFHNGKDYPIERVFKIPQNDICDMLCRIRYGIPWSTAFRKWETNAVLEGNDRSVLSREYCLWVIYAKD